MINMLNYIHSDPDELQPLKSHNSNTTFSAHNLYQRAINEAKKKQTDI